jgi:hypothetical protein
MDRQLQDKMNIALTREERVLLWDLIGREYDRLQNSGYTDEQFIKDKVKQLKVLELLIIG